MLDNVNYDLMETITIISKSLYRYEAYAQDAKQADCRSCQEIWRKIAEHRQQELELLLTELREHINQGKFSPK